MLIEEAVEFEIQRIRQQAERPAQDEVERIAVLRRGYGPREKRGHGHTRRKMRYTFHNSTSLT
jgi:hypothetical protein